MLIVDSSGADKQLIPALSADLIFIPGVGSVVGGKWIQLFPPISLFPKARA